MKNKETPLLLVLSSWNNKEQTDEKQERTHFANSHVRFSTLLSAKWVLTKFIAV